MAKEAMKVNNPGPTMYVLLFIFYTIWILQAFGAVSFHFIFGFDEFDNYALEDWLFLPLFCVGALLCVYSVIKVLRGDPDCITALKWALMYSFLYTLVHNSSLSNPSYSLWTFLVLILARPLFYLVFYLYLCFSKGIKRHYPKAGRRFAPSGWIWVGITACLFGLAFRTGYDAYKKDRFCQRVDLQSLVLEEGLTSDGYVAFRSDKAWVPCSEPADTISTDDEDVFCLQTMSATDGLCSILLYSGRSVKKDVRTHNRIITNLLVRYDREVVETAHRDTLLGDKRLITTTFETKSTAEGRSYTVATVFDANTPKCMVLVSDSQGVDGREWLNEIVRSLKWDLQDISKAEHEKSHNDKEDDITYRIGDGYNDPHAYVFGGFLQGCNPRLFFREMLLEHHEGKITYSQGYYPFYY